MEKILEEIGLSSSESKVYLGLLKLGECRVGKIIEETEIASSKIYDVISKLVKKGLVSYKIKEKTKYFRSSHPKYIQLLLEEKKKHVENSQEILKKELEKNSFGSVNEEGRVEFFEGMKGVRMAHNILFSKARKNSILKYMFPYQIITEEQDLFYKKLWLDHQELNLNSRGLVMEKLKDDSLFNKIIDHKTMKFVSFPLPGTIDILENTILIISWTNKPTAVLIESGEIVKHFENYFDSIWEVI